MSSRNVPLGKMQLDYDTKIWDARLAPGDGQTQKVDCQKQQAPARRSAAWCDRSNRSVIKEDAL